jgi:hypothetical protein
MAANLDKPHLWKQDMQASADHYNRWFIEFAPRAFMEAKARFARAVEQALLDSRGMRELSPKLLVSSRQILSILRASCSPPLGIRRLAALAHVSQGFLASLEHSTANVANSGGCQPELRTVCQTISSLLDREAFPWLEGAKQPSEDERTAASRAIADRWCSATAVETVACARRTQQLSVLSVYLDSLGYREIANPGQVYSPDGPGTYTCFVSVPVGAGGNAIVLVDAAIQPIEARRYGTPVLLRAQSRGSFAESARMRLSHRSAARALRITYGRSMPFLLLLGGYTGAAYLGAQAAEGIDWVWQHRVADLHVFGV